MKNVQQPREVSFNLQNLFVLCVVISLFACLFGFFANHFFFLCCRFLFTVSELPTDPSLSGNSSSSSETPKDEFLRNRLVIFGIDEINYCILIDA